MPAYIIMDTQDPERIAPFWCEVMGVRVRSGPGRDDGRYVMLEPNREGLMIGLQRVPDSKLGKNRAHFDVLVDDLDEATAQLERLGGRRLDSHTHELDRYSWRCMADPEGNEFCLHTNPPST
jgi:predicted enzyme related to lactoylglutathione lyase